MYVPSCSCCVVKLEEDAKSQVNFYRNLKGFKSASFFPAKVRSLISDFAVIIAIITMVIVDYLVGVPTPKMQVPDTVRPTWEGRQWFIHPFGTEPVPGVQGYYSTLS